MQIPQGIPYNPNRRVIVLLLVVAALAFGSGRLSVFPMRLSLSVSTLLVSMAALLVLRRLVWRRQLTVAETMITVPSGFLRLRPIDVPYEQVVSLWVSRVWVTSVICLRTPDRKVEIQDIYLPDSVVFHDLQRFLESMARSTRRPNDGAA